MGLALTCPGCESTALNERFDVLLRSISFDGDYEKSNLCSGKLVEGSVSFKRKEADQFHLETKNSFKNSSSGTENAIKPNSAKRARFSEETIETPCAEPHSPKHEAAVKLQKVYKSFRTRRQLADCAVLVEQRWWKLLDFAMLKRSSVSFFDIEKPESAVSKWSRARTRAAKVGKGLSKNAKARKLALQHWLEAIDPRHRYGHNLHFYYVRWLCCESKQPFFYWLDVGEGKEFNLEACPRPKLQQQCIKYLGPKEREAYEVIVEDGRLSYKKSRQIVDTTGGPKDSKWIFVLSTSKNFYVGLKRKGVFQHSSFLAGGATSAAGRLVVENGFLKAVWPHSGHYRPTEENFEDFMSFLEENNVALNDVKKSPIEEDVELGTTLQSCGSEPDLSCSNVNAEAQTISNFFHEMDSNAAIPKIACSRSERDLFEFENSYSFKEGQASEREDKKGSDSSTIPIQDHEMHEHSDHKSMEGSSTSKGQLKLDEPKFFIEGQENPEEEPIPEELIIENISSKKGGKPCKLGLQLPFKWTTASGARISYVRNYPPELQFHALEQVNLSPRGAAVSRPVFSPRGLPSPCSKIQETST